MAGQHLFRILALPPISFHLSSSPYRYKYGILCEGDHCTAFDGAMVEIIMPTWTPAWGCLLNMFASSTSLTDVADAWTGSCTSSSGVNHIICDGGHWTTHFAGSTHSWDWVTFPPQADGGGARYLCEGKKLLPLSQCPDPFQVSGFDDPTSGTAPVPTGGMGAEFQMCLPAEQGWDPSTTVSVSESSSISWTKSDELDVGGGIEFSTPAKMILPSAKWSAHFDSKHTYTNGASTSSETQFTIGNQFHMPVMPFDQFIHITAAQFLYKAEVVLKGKSGCCGNGAYDQKGCDKDAEVHAEVTLTTSSNDFTDANMVCIEKDPW